MFGTIANLFSNNKLLSKGILYLIIVTAVIAVTYIGFNKYTETIESNTAYIIENKRLEDQLEIQIKTSEISNDILNEFIQEQLKEYRDQTRVREEIINEYINLSSIKKDVPEQINKSNEKTNPETTGSNSTDSNIAISKLSERMHEHYCRAKRQSPPCDTN